MRKSLKTARELQELSLAAIRRYEGCETVRSVAVKLIIDDRANYNWSISVTNVGNADAFFVRRIALVVHESLSEQYDMQEAAMPNATPGTWRLRN